MENYGKLHNHVEKLRVLNFVGRAGSITKAAALLNMTQAAASHAIRVLEDVLDVRLLHREPRGIRLTDSGQVLFDFSQRLLADIQTAEAKALNPYQQNAGTLRVGTHETLAIHVWPTFLRQFRDRHPNISVSLISGRIDALIHGLLAYEYQLIMSVDPLKHRLIQSEVVYAGEMGLFIGNVSSTKAHPILKRAALTMADVNEVPILTDAAAHVHQNLPIPAFLMGEGFTLSQFFELNSFEAAMRLAMVGIGIAVVPERNAVAYVKDGTLRRLKVNGINAKNFGRHRVCVSVLKDEPKNQPILGLLFRELSDYCKKE